MSVRVRESESSIPLPGPGRSRHVASRRAHLALWSLVTRSDGSFVGVFFTYSDTFHYSSIRSPSLPFEYCPYFRWQTLFSPYARGRSRPLSHYLLHSTLLALLGIGHSCLLPKRVLVYIKTLYFACNNSVSSEKRLALIRNVRVVTTPCLPSNSAFANFLQVFVLVLNSQRRTEPPSHHAS